MPTNSSLKNKLSSLSNDNVINSGEHTIVGLVTKSYEDSNVCNLNISDPMTGRVYEIKDIPVRRSDSNGVIGWFPSVNDIVSVKNIGNIYEITGPCYSYNGNTHRHDNDTPNNVLTNSYNYTIGGNIF